jgi:type II secretory pathway pseudopilin PulG
MKYKILHNFIQTKTTADRQQSGFTIIETLVAITILMVAIAGPLTVAHKGLTAAIYARDQMIGSYLAQDAIEYVKNQRDSNKLAGRAWLYGFDGCGSISNGVSCTVDTIRDVVTPCLITESCSLLRIDDTAGGYVHSGGVSSLFRRVIKINTNGDDPKAARVVAIVSWTTGTIANSITSESDLYDTFR